MKPQVFQVSGSAWHLLPCSFCSRADAFRSLSTKDRPYCYIKMSGLCIRLFCLSSWHTWWTEKRAKMEMAAQVIGMQPSPLRMLATLSAQHHYACSSYPFIVLRLVVVLDEDTWIVASSHNSNPSVLTETTNLKRSVSSAFSCPKEVTNREVPLSQQAGHRNLLDSQGFSNNSG